MSQSANPLLPPPTESREPAEAVKTGAERPLLAEGGKLQAGGGAVKAPWWRWRWLEGALVLTVLVLLLEDRWRLCVQHLFLWTDEDQAIMWYGAYELMHGRVHEPCFFGQAYNSCLEGFLAIPLLWRGVSYAVAVPLATVFLGLLPYLLFSYAAWRRKQSVMAAVALAVPLVLPIRYAMMTGMPRGFVTGVAIGAIPAVMLLPPAVRAWRWPNFVGIGWGWVAKLWRKKRAAVAEAAVVPAEEPAPVVVKKVNTWPKWVRGPWPGVYWIGVVLLVYLCDRFDPWVLIGLLPGGIYAYVALARRWQWPLYLKRTWPKTRYFFAAALALLAIQLNPNVLVLLVPVAVYALVTTFLDWRFWTFGGLGLGVAAPYLWYVHQFYYVWHDDYRQYLRDRDFTWSWANYHEFIRDYIMRDRIFQDLVPNAVADSTKLGPHPVPEALIYAGVAIAILMLLRLRVAGLLTVGAAAAFLMATFAYSRMTDGRETIAFPYDRMYLGLPPLFVWLLLLVNWRPWPEWGWLKWWRAWPTRWAMVGVTWACLGVVVWYSHKEYVAKEADLPAEIAEATGNTGMVQPVKVSDIEAGAKQAAWAAKKAGARLILIQNGRDSKVWAYTLPELSGIETLMPWNERRTWRLAEESVTRGGKVLEVTGMNGGGGGRAGRGGGNGGGPRGGRAGRGGTVGVGVRNAPAATEPSNEEPEGPLTFTVLDLYGHSMIYVEQQRADRVRWFIPPANANLLHDVAPIMAFPSRR